MRGGQWQILFLLEGLAKAGVMSVLLAPRESVLLERARAAGLEATALRFRFLLESSRRCDVVHAHSGRAHTLAAVAGARPLVVSRRVAFPVKRGPASRWKYSRADRYLAVSQFVREQLLDAGIAGEKITVVHDGVPLLERSAGGGGIFPASDDPRKGAALALEAASLAGVELKSSSDLNRDLQHAGYMVYLTESEGLGSGALLAMSAGVPVIASNVGGLREVVTDGESGFLTPNSAQEVGEVIRRLEADAPLRERMGAAARARVERLFSRERMVERTIEVYREVFA